MLYIAILTLISIILLGLFFLYHLLINISSPPYVPTLNKKVSGIISSELKNNNISTFYELGCGTAEISFFVEKNFPQIQIIAIEHDFFIYYLAKIKAFFTKSKIRFYRNDIQKFKFNQKPCLMYCYLYPKYMNTLYTTKKFSNSRVISLDFEIKNIKPEKRFILNKSSFQKQILIYNLLNTK